MAFGNFFTIHKFAIILLELLRCPPHIRIHFPKNTIFCSIIKLTKYRAVSLYYRYTHVYNPKMVQQNIFHNIIQRIWKNVFFFMFGIIITRPHDQLVHVFFSNATHNVVFIINNHIIP